METTFYQTFALLFNDTRIEFYNNILTNSDLLSLSY